MFKRIISVLALIFVLFSALSSASPVLADSDGSKVAGVIAAVDTIANTVTITPANGGASVTLNVDASTKIKKNGQPATLANLLVGEKARAKYNPNTLLTSGIETKSESASGQANVRGVIASVDSAANTLTITPANGGANVTLNVDASTKIKNNDKPAAFADLSIGEKANVRFNPVTLLASGIEAKSEPVAGQANVRGVIVSVDAAASTMTITPASGGANVTFNVDASTIIKKNRQIVALDTLTVGDRAQIKYDSTTLLAFNIEVKR